jgi:hypothetical protein
VLRHALDAGRLLLLAAEEIQLGERLSHSVSTVT